MSMRKFLNPHNAATGIEPVSRSQIFASDDEPVLGTERREELTKCLETYIRSSIVSDDSAPAVRPSPNKPRGTDVENGKEVTQAFEFRLVSGSKLPRQINIEPKPPKAIRVIEREYEDGAEFAALRKRRAKEVAVDFSWLIAQSQMSFPPPPNDKGKCRVLYPLAPLSAAVPNVMVTERAKPVASTATKHPEAKPLHDLKGSLCCPLLPVSSPDKSMGCARRRRLRSTRKQQLRPF